MLSLALAIAILAAARDARAEDIHLLPPAGTPALRQTAGAEAVQATRGTLEIADLTVVAGDAVGEECGEDPACISGKVAFAAVVSVWARSDDPAPREVAVTLIRGSEHYDGRAQVEGDDVASAAARAATLALAESRGESSGILVVAGSPDGANVVVDGERIGELPRAESSVSDGTHQIAISHMGYESQTHELTTSGGGRLNVALVAEEDESSSSGGAGWRIGLGAGLVALGGVGFGLGLGEAAIEGQCASPCTGNPVERHVFDGLSATAIGIGLAAIVVGTVLIIRGLHFMARVNPQSASVQLRKQF